MNVRKHARARSVAVRLSAEDEYLIAEVRDDGVGFEPEGVPNGHLGLGTMRQRADLLGGTLEVRSAPGRGTTIRLTLPLRPGSAAGGQR
jgi:signal transduction histidine kinase